MSGSSAPTVNRIAGIVTFTIGGTPYNASDVTWKPSVPTRSWLKDQTGIPGYKEMPETGYISGTLRDAQGFSVAAIANKTNATVVVQQANGKPVYGSGLVNTEATELNTAEGQFKVKFEGPDVTDEVPSV
ncbi:MAG TPA: phage tail tube protein [Acetobacteraceae bacterium]|nr:phage tail tube protein [Acetobacteraceae bacterium]